MNYMLLMYLPEGESVPPEDEVLTACAIPVIERTVAKGQFLAAGLLRPTSTSTSVRVREGARLVTDGPFAETREQIAGYLMIEAKDLDEAILVASEHPAALGGTVEIRPVLPLFPEAREDR